MLARLLQVLLFGSLVAWRDLIPEELSLIFPLVVFFITLVILAIVLYFAGLIVVSKKRALFSDAFMISLLGTILSTVFFMFIPSLLALALSMLVWLLLIKRLYETSWLKAIAVGIVAIIIFLAVTAILALFFGILSAIFERFLYSTILIL